MAPGAAQCWRDGRASGCCETRKRTQVAVWPLVSKPAMKMAPTSGSSRSSLSGLPARPRRASCACHRARGPCRTGWRGRWRRASPPQKRRAAGARGLCRGQPCVQAVEGRRAAPQPYPGQDAARMLHPLHCRSARALLGTPSPGPPRAAPVQRPLSVMCDCSGGRAHPCAGPALAAGSRRACRGRAPPHACAPAAP